MIWIWIQQFVSLFLEGKVALHDCVGITCVTLFGNSTVTHIYWRIQTPQLGASLPYPSISLSFPSLPLEVGPLNTAKGPGGAL